MITAVKSDLVVTGLQLKHEPDLLLTDADRLVAPPDVTLGETIMEPILSAAENAHRIAPEPDLLVEFAVHRLFGGLVGMNAALRELPGVVITASCPEQATALIAQNYADVGPVSVTIDHVLINLLFAIRSILTQHLIVGKSARLCRDAGQPLSLRAKPLIFIDETETRVTLALFDLDNTLIAGDSDYLWGQFLISMDAVDRDHYERENLRYYEAYQAGTLEINEYLRFALAPLAANEPAQLQAWRERFINEWIAPIIAPGTAALLSMHRKRGDRLVIITATNRFVTEPIAALLGIDDLLATEAEIIDGRYTGNPSGVPCFREGKVERLGVWLADNGENLEQSSFYSDSHNDLPLLEQVVYPFAVDPDPQLKVTAESRNWPILTLRDGV